MELFPDASIGFKALMLLAFLLAATEIGFRAGRRRRAGADDAARSEIGTIQTAALGLLGLLMAFTLSMAVSRFERRIELVINESNAISTTELRARMLPEPERREFRDLLRRYVDVRIEYYEVSADEQLVQAAIRKTEELQGQLWSRASAMAEKDPRAVTTGLLLASLNEAIDLHAKRIVAMGNRVPQTVIWLLCVVAVLTMASVGYGCGLANRRQFIFTLMLASLFALVGSVILDLDRPREGLIKVGQKSMISLRDSLNKAAP